jgi:apolipoprotein D and lipocalin family protein
MWKTMICAVLAAGAAVAPAFAGAPEPRQAFDLKRLSGRWYEIARTPNLRQKHCRASTTQWSFGADDRIEVDSVCIGKNGDAKSVKARAVVVDGQRNAKVRMSFLGGLVSQEYWLLDRAGDYRWLIMGTPGGNYVWIFTREARPATGVKAEAISRAGKLGYKTANLVEDEH